MILETVVVGMLETNCYILGCERTRQAIVIDPGDDPFDILEVLRRHRLSLECLVATHAHFDHVLAVRALQEATAAPFYLSTADRPLLATQRRTAILWIGRDPGELPEVHGDIAPGTGVVVGDLSLEVRSTPGHSPGGITLVDHGGRRAFTGDTVFAGSIGRTDLPGGELKVLLQAIRNEILTLPGDYTLLPGHGPSSTVTEERTSNPFLMMSPAGRWGVGSG
jgi:glyoxylase-like metal-dependent hydrolase (beta-lactamase superfamily II)